MRLRARCQPGHYIRRPRQQPKMDYYDKEHSVQNHSCRYTGQWMGLRARDKLRFHGCLRYRYGNHYSRRNGRVDFRA
jgi:hypothetical protein